jgi:hypothetical protein
MSDIPRYTVEQMVGFPEGFEYIDGDNHVPVGTVLVTYADHMEALRQAREESWREWRTTNFPTAYDLGLIDGRERGQRDALAAAAQRVEALNEWTYTSWDGISASVVDRESAIAAIKGEL